MLKVRSFLSVVVVSVGVTSGAVFASHTPPEDLYEAPNPHLVHPEKVFVEITRLIEVAESQRAQDSGYARRLYSDLQEFVIPGWIDNIRRIQSGEPSDASFAKNCAESISLLRAALDHVRQQVSTPHAPAPAPTLPTLEDSLRHSGELHRPQEPRAISDKRYMEAMALVDAWNKQRRQDEMKAVEEKRLELVNNWEQFQIEQAIEESVWLAEGALLAAGAQTCDTPLKALDRRIATLEDNLRGAQRALSGACQNDDDDVDDKGARERIATMSAELSDMRSQRTNLVSQRIVPPKTQTDEDEEFARALALSMEGITVGSSD